MRGYARSREAQTRPGGRLVIPWSRLGTIALTVADDGKSATGWVQGLATFMPGRGTDQGREYHAIRSGAATDRSAHVDRDLGALTDPNLLFALRVSHPDIRISTEGDGRGLAVRLHDGISSWATAFTDESGATDASEGGPRHLLAEVEAGRRHWEERGSPPLWDFGMTVGPDHQEVWVGAPDARPYFPT
ncbi:hypothetical protein NJL88_35170 [Streptomyces sp. DK15]|uniref:hypothetical protein n=1 Tax=Streptomyces sp. DK15 TaxID=2957499 RepID=UPI0029BFA174|nr:hypothetical protein [Streptomyces sp. DK15]MDX2395206.1 hypothetical protein [Streptomyces sp. DK15]